MGKGTPSMGKRMGKPVHIMCRRCGRRSYNLAKKRCAACGYGESPRIKQYAWQNKKLTGERLR